MTNRQLADVLARAALRGYFDNPERGFTDMSKGSAKNASQSVYAMLQKLLKEEKEEKSSSTALVQLNTTHSSIEDRLKIYRRDR